MRSRDGKKGGEKGRRVSDDCGVVPKKRRGRKKSEEEKFRQELQK